jgi:protein phosphatase
MTIVEAYAATHVGKVRKGNEDNYLLMDVPTADSTISGQIVDEATKVEARRFEATSQGIVLAVSDGMGGALAGEVASRLAVETVTQKFSNDENLYGEFGHQDRLLTLLYESAVAANENIFTQGRSDARFQGMGATFTGAIVTPDSVELVQVGDSRAYVIRESGIHQLTKDQSLVQQLIDTHQISAEDAETHALRNVILQALGAQYEVFPVTARLLPNDGDILMLCSDGLSNKVGADDIKRIVQDNSEDLARACEKLIATANDNGGEDNITVILARIAGDGLGNEESLRVIHVHLDDIHDTEES